MSKETPKRRATIARETRETRIRLTIDLDDPSRIAVRTGVGCFDHMLEALATHGRFGLEIEATGDLELDAHHLVEDTGIALGAAFRQALGSDLRIVRFASAYAPLDDALARAVVDVSGRAYLAYEVPVSRDRVGAFDTELAEEFWRSFTSNPRINLHLDLIRGENAHHQLEASFKAVALALRAAVRPDP